MRCISPHERYSIQVFEARTRRGSDSHGTVVEFEESPSINAQFEKGSLLDHEVELALIAFDYSGMAEGSNPLSRIAVYDTEVFAAALGWDDEFHTKVCDRLRHLQSLYPAQFIIVDQPLAPRPWPTYDEDSLEEILLVRERFRVSPQAVRLYEEQREFPRGQIVEAMLELEAGQTAEDGVFVVTV